jgi:hypothetical protein
MRTGLPGPDAVAVDEGPTGPLQIEDIKLSFAALWPVYALLQLKAMCGLKFHHEKFRSAAVNFAMEARDHAVRDRRPRPRRSARSEG